MKRSRSRAGGLAVIAAATILSTACGASRDAHTEATASPEATPSTATADRVVDIFSGFAADDTLYRGPRALASDSQLVVSGTVESVMEGRTFALVEDPDVAPWSTALMRVKVTATLGGSLDGDTGLVELPLPLRQPASRLGAAAQGEDVVLYLVRVLPESPGDSDYVKSFGPAWPGDGVVHEPTNTEGFIIEDEGFIDTPLAASDSFDSDVDLADLEPGTLRWPERSEAHH